MNSAQDTLAGGLPHSEIPGSTIARISPRLFAACHVLHRLSVPRHPPNALQRLIRRSPPHTETKAPSTIAKPRLNTQHFIFTRLAHLPRSPIQQRSPKRQTATTRQPTPTGQSHSYPQ